MPKEKRPLDVEALLMWLIERVETHIAGGDLSNSGLLSVLIPALSGSGAVFAGGLVTQSGALSVVVPAVAGSGAVTSVGAVSNSGSLSVVLPGFSGSGVVI